MASDRSIHEIDLRLDLRSLLDAVEAAPPVDAVIVLAEELAHMVNADDVSFLIADISGDALIRFLATPSRGPLRVHNDDPDSLVTVPLSGSPHERALRSQKVCVEQSTLQPACLLP